MKRFGTRTLLCAIVLPLLACGAGTGEGPGAREPVAVQVETPPPPPPPIDPLALVPDEVEAVVLARAVHLRGTAVAPVVGEWLRSEGLLASLEAAGIDPLRDIDELVIAGRTGDEAPEAVVLVHHLGEAQLLEAFDHLGGSRGARVDEREGRRIAFVEASPARLLLASPTIAVLTTAERIGEITRRLHERSPRIELCARLESLGQRAGDLAETAGILAVSGPPARWNEGPGHLGLPRPTQVGGLASFATGASFFVQAGYETDGEAEQCERTARTFLSGTSPATLLLRLMGLGRALRAAVIEREGSLVLLRAHLDQDEVGRLVERIFSLGAPGRAP